MIPSGSGYFSSKTSSNLVDQGRKAPSILLSDSRQPSPFSMPSGPHEKCTDSNFHTHPSSCCSSPSPRSPNSFAPSCKNRLCTFRTAQLNLRYVLSPHPNVVNSVLLSQSPGSFFLSINFQNACILDGISPWPVVAAMKMTTGHEGSEEMGDKEDAERQVAAKC